MRTWRLQFAGMPPGPNARLHWSVRAASNRRWRFEAALQVKLGREGIPPLPRIRISAIFYRRRLGVADEDNDRARLKPLLDGIVVAGVVPTDTRAFVEWGPVTEARGAPGLELVIEEVE